MKKQLLTLMFVVIATVAHAQWVSQTSNITPGYYAQFISAVDNDVCWGLVADPANQLTPVQQFTRTIDGGNLWISGTITNAAGLAPSCIFALNADTAWVAMFNPTGGAGRILRTDNGGGTWTHQSTALFNAAGNFPNWVYFWDANNGVCMGDPTAGYLEIYTTVDGGVTWIRTPDANITPELTGEFGITDVYAAQGDSTIFFGTNLGRVYKSADRGLNWTVSQTPFNNLYIGALAFSSPDHGIATLGSVTAIADVAVTDDGGATWTFGGGSTSGFTTVLNLAYLPGTAGTFFLSNPAAGSPNGTAYSPNGGIDWVPVDPLIHSDIDFVNDSVGWTGSNELNAPMFKWSTPIEIATDDVASQSIDVSDNTGQTTTNPLATFVNNGLNTQTFDVTMEISPGGYTSTKTITGLAFFATSQAIFDPWTPAATGVYTIKVYTSLAADTDHNNDTLIKGVTVYESFENYGWVSMTDVPAATFGLAGAFNLEGPDCASPGSVYSIGGADFTAVQAFNNSFSTGSMSWGAVTPMPVAKYQFSSFNVNGKIYCAGGYSAGFTPDGSMQIYDITNDSWSSGAAMPIPVGDYAAGVYADSLIYYVGGYSGQDQNAVQIYNTFSNAWTIGTSKPGTAVAGLRGDINGSTIVITGGYSQTLGGPVADSYTGTISAANPNNITWAPIAPFPIGPSSRLAAGTVFKDLRPLVIFVGGDPTGQGLETLGDCWGYDVNLGQWLIGAEKTTAVSNISNLMGIVYNDSLWMVSVSGYDGAVITPVHEWLSLGHVGTCPLGVNEINADHNTIQLYPNPSSGDVFITISSGVNSVLLADISGKEVRVVNSIKAQQRLLINISALPAGIYFVQALNEDGVVVASQKLVKQ